MFDFNLSNTVVKYSVVLLFAILQIENALLSVQCL